MQGYADLPVCVDVSQPLADEVQRYVESEAGWQVIAPDGPLRPVLTIVDRMTPARPCVLLTSSPADPSVVRDAMVAGAADVIAWPDDRRRLLEAPARVRRARRTDRGPRLLRVAGARGGTGTSTVALAAAAAVVWAGGRALVVGDNDLVRLAGLGPWRGAGAAEVGALGEQAADEVGGIAVAVPGVPGLSLLGGGGAPVDDVGGWPYDLVVADTRSGGASSADLVVGCADAALRDVPAAVPIVVVEHGPLDRSGVARCLGRPPCGWLPYSARVARAGSAGRVPSALPGSWVAALRRALAGARAEVSRAAV